MQTRPGEQSLGRAFLQPDYTRAGATSSMALCASSSEFHWPTSSFASLRRQCPVSIRRRTICAGPRPNPGTLPCNSWANTTPKQLDCLNTRLEEVRSPPVPVQLGELGFFDRAGVLFADVSVSPALAALQQRVVEATTECGFAAEARPFRPHVTLARVKNQRRGAQLRKLQNKTLSRAAFPRFTAREFLLYKSHLSAQGSHYEVIRRFPLAGP